MVHGTLSQVAKRCSRVNTLRKYLFFNSAMASDKFGKGCLDYFLIGCLMCF